MRAGRSAASASSKRSSSSAARRRRLIPREVEQTAEHLEVLPSGEDLVDGSELSGEPEQLTNGRGLVDHVTPEDLGAPRVRREQGREHANERGLPGSVRPEQSEDRSLRDVEVDTRERSRRAEALDHTLDVDGGSGGAGRNHARATILRARPASQAWAAIRCHRANQLTEDDRVIAATCCLGR